MSAEILTRVALHGVPRSGTSWVGEILNSSPRTIYRFQPLFSYALKDFLTPASSKAEIDQFFELLGWTSDDFLDQTARRRSGEFPSFTKSGFTHVVYKEVRHINILWNLLRKAEDVLLCGVIRNPLAVINSWLRAPREFRRDLGWIESEEWRYALRKNLNRPEEFNGYEKWKEAALTFRRLKEQYPCRVHILKYSELLNSPMESTASLFNAVGLDVTNSTSDFLEASRSITRGDSYSVYRADGSDEKWRKDLDPRIVEEILADLAGSELESYLS